MNTPRVQSMSNRDLAQSLAQFADTIDDGRPPNPESKIREAARRLGAFNKLGSVTRQTGKSSDREPLDYVARFRYAVRQLVGRPPSVAMVVDWLSKANDDLQSWVLDQPELPEFYQGIAVLDAAAILADAPPEDAPEEVYPGSPYAKASHPADVVVVSKDLLQSDPKDLAIEAIDRLIGALGSQIIDPDNDGDVHFGRQVIAILKKESL